MISLTNEEREQLLTSALSDVRPLYQEFTRSNGTITLDDKVIPVAAASNWDDFFEEPGFVVDTDGITYSRFSDGYRPIRLIRSKLKTIPTVAFNLRTAVPLSFDEKSFVDADGSLDQYIVLRNLNGQSIPIPKHDIIEVIDGRYDITPSDISFTKKTNNGAPELHFFQTVPLAYISHRNLYTDTEGRIYGQVLNKQLKPVFLAYNRRNLQLTETLENIAHMCAVTRVYSKAVLLSMHLCSHLPEEDRDAILAEINYACIEAQQRIALQE